MYRRTRSVTISNDEIEKESRLSKVYQFLVRDHSQSRETGPSPLHLACENNDLALAKVYLKTMKPKEIDRQCLPKNETALHVATRLQNKEMIEMLLTYGAQRSLKNVDGQQAYELAITEEIKDLFQRRPSSRFGFVVSFSKTDSRLQRKIKCQSCSLINDSTFYEWELVDRNASQKALRFRRELKPSVSMNEQTLKKKLYSIKKGYITARIKDISSVDGARIHDYFKRALHENDPQYIIRAYTTCQRFSELLNRDMARNVIHDLKNGCSKFSCDCLYSTEDGTKSITNILLHHPTFEKVRYKGRVYRGIVVPPNVLDHYKVGSRIITTTFLSTSKNFDVAAMFSDKSVPNATTHSFFCIYEILNDNRTAIDISAMSEYRMEDEVLILPYAAFLITNIDQGLEATTIYLKEQCLTHIFEMNNSLEPTVHFLELIGNSLVHDTHQTVSDENDQLRPRSKTVPL